MSGRRLTVLALGLVALLVTAWFLVPGADLGGPSSLSHGRLGLLAARQYLAAQGTEVELLKQPLELAPDTPESGASVLTALPWRADLGSRGGPALVEWVQRGGTLLVAVGRTSPQGPEAGLFSAFGIEVDESEEKPPVEFAAWRDWANAQLRLLPTAAMGADAPALELRAPGWWTVPPAAARVLYRTAEDKPAVYDLAVGQGRVVVLPGELLSNARLGRAGYADLLESLRLSLPAPWWFDEYHHGLVTASTVRSWRPSLAFDLFLVHLLALYGLAVLALGRRFGPVWREPPVRTGSAATFLCGLGRLHERAGHHAAAGRLLLERVGQLDPRFVPSPRLAARVPPSSAAELLALARAVAMARGKSAPGATAPAEEDR